MSVTNTVVLQGSAGVGLSVPGSPSGQYRTDCPVGGSCHPSLFLPASCEFGGKKNILICEAFTVYRKMISHTLNKSFLLILSYNIEKMKSEFLDGLKKDIIFVLYGY